MPSLQPTRHKIAAKSPARKRKHSFLLLDRRLCVASFAAAAVMDASALPPPRFPLGALIVITLSILPAGLLASVIGPTLPGIQASYGGLSSAEAALTVTLVFTGTTCGDVIWMLIMHNRWRGGWLSRWFKDEVRGSQRLLAIGMICQMVAHILIFTLPTSIGSNSIATPTTPTTPDPNGGGNSGGSTSDSTPADTSTFTGPLPSQRTAFNVFLMSAFLAGVGGGLNSLSANCIVSLWDERIVSSALNLLNIGPLVGTVGAPWIQKGLSSVAPIAPSGDAWRLFFLMLAIYCFSLLPFAILKDLRAPPPFVSRALQRPQPPSLQSQTPQPSPDPARAETYAPLATSPPDAATPTPPVSTGAADRTDLKIEVAAANNESKSTPVISAGSSASPLALMTAPESFPPTRSPAVAPAPSDAVAVHRPRPSTPRQLCGVTSHVLTLACDPRYWLLIASMFMCNGSVVSVGAWQYTLAFAKGYHATTATISTSMFWGGILLGRVVASKVSTRFARTASETVRFLLVSAFLTIIAPLALVFARSRGVLDAAAMLTGLALAPLNPLLTSLTINSELFGEGRTSPPSNALAIGGVIVASQLGALSLPAVLGALASASGVLELSMLMITAAALVTFLALLSFQSAYRTAIKTAAPTPTDPSSPTPSQRPRATLLRPHTPTPPTPNAAAQLLPTATSNPAASAVTSTEPAAAAMTEMVAAAAPEATAAPPVVAAIASGDGSATASPALTSILPGMPLAAR